MQHPVFHRKQGDSSKWIHHWHSQNCDWSENRNEKSINFKKKEQKNDKSLEILHIKHKSWVKMEPIFVNVLSLVYCHIIEVNLLIHVKQVSRIDTNQLIGCIKLHYIHDLKFFRVTHMLQTFESLCQNTAKCLLLNGLFRGLWAAPEKSGLRQKMRNFVRFTFHTRIIKNKTETFSL